MANVNEGPTQTVNDGGYITVWKQVSGVFGWYKIPVDAVADIKALADTALQPNDVTEIVNEDPEAYVRVEDFQSQIANLQATIDFQSTLIANLETLIGANLITILEDGIVEPGVVG